MSQLCFSADTNILTIDGIKNIKDIMVGDKVYTLNPDNLNVEIENITSIGFSHINDIIEVKGRTVDWRISKNHNLFCSYHCNKPIFRKIDDMVGYVKQYEIIKHLPIDIDNNPVNINLLDYMDDRHVFVLKPNPRIRTGISKLGFKRKNGISRYYEAKINDVGDIKEFIQKYQCKAFIKDSSYNSHYQPIDIPIVPFLKVLAWYITEGNVSKGKYAQVVITQHHKIYRDEIAQAIRDMGYILSVDKIHITFMSRLFRNYIYANKLVGSYYKSIPKFIFGLSLALRVEFLDTLMKGDGDKDRTRYTTASRSLANDIVHLAFTCGKDCLLRSNIENGKIIYRIIFRAKKERRSVKSKHVRLKIVDNEKIYIIDMIKNSIVYVGNNGFMGWLN